MTKNVTQQKNERPAIDNPFVGLRPFTPAESDLFFGREGQSDEILSKLIANRFVTIIGASGSGKSSLIYCGVIPLLRKKFSGNGTSWNILSMRPGNDPLGNMAAMIKDATGSSETGSIEKSLRENNRTLIDQVGVLRSGKEEKILILVDQFEELFRFSTTRKTGITWNDSRIFVNQIVNSVSDMDSGINVIITMRSDFIGECAHFQGLTDLINASNYLVPHMAKDNYRRAITGPVEYAGAKIEPELVETILGEIGEKTDQLPVLQHALMRTWAHWKLMKQSDAPISSTNYDAVGQMGEAMSRHANEAYEELDTRGKEICEELFKTITEKGSDNKGVRHPTKLKTIAAIARCSTAELIKVVDVFRQAGRSFLTPGPGVEIREDTIIDVSHESLMRLWNRLSEWVEEEAASVQMYMRLSEASEMFQEGRTTLWRPPDLQLAVNWRNENRPTLTWAERFNPAFERAMVYLRTSEKEFQTEEENKIRAQKRQLRRSRITAMILGTAAIISVFFMFYAFVKQMEADKNFRIAEEQRQKATEQQGIAEAQADTARINAERASINQRLAELNADSARINADEASRQEKLALEAADRALRNAQLAKEQEALAKANRDTAQINEKKAVENAKEALRLRMISIGKGMAVKSLQVKGKGELQALLAFQAYKFNTRNKGVPNDADIYMGLYNVAKVFGGEGYAVFTGHKGSVKSIGFNPAGNMFYSSGADGKVYRWDSKNPADTLVIFQGNEIMEKIAVSPDSKYLACGSDRATIKVFPINGGMTFEMTGHSGKIKSMVFSNDSKTLYTSSLDGKVLAWNMETRQSSVVSNGPDAIVSLDINNAGNLLAGAGTNGTVTVWSLSTPQPIDTISPGKGGINVVKFADKDLLAIGYMNGYVDIYDMQLSRARNEFQAHDARVSDIRFNNKLEQMATSSMDGSVKIWNMADLTEPPITFDDNNGFVLALAFSPDGTQLLSGCDSDIDNLVARPSHVNYMTGDLCNILTRNMTQDEWDTYVARDIEYEETCNSNELSIKVQEKKGE